MSCRATLFDLDNTLHDRDAGLEAFVRHQYRTLFPSNAGQEEAWLRRYVELDRQGKVWKDIVYEALTREFRLERTSAELLLEYEEGFARLAALNPGLLETLTAIRRRGWKVGIVTNGRTKFQNRTIDALGIRALTDAIVVSEACGLRKPDPAIFERAMRELEADPARSWFVGDDPKDDVGGARGAGLRAVWFRTRHHRPPESADGEIDALPQLLEILEP